MKLIIEDTATCGLQHLMHMEPNSDKLAPDERLTIRPARQISFQSWQSKEKIVIHYAIANILLNFKHNDFLHYEFQQKQTCNHLDHAILRDYIGQNSYKLKPSASISSSSTSIKSNEVLPISDEFFKAPIHELNFSLRSISIVLPQHMEYPIQPEMHIAVPERAISESTTSADLGLVISSNRKKCSIYICLIVFATIVFGASLLAKTNC